jgi:hypothetical protein
MAKSTLKRKKDRPSTVDHVKKTWSHSSFSQKVMYVLSLLIVLSMVLALFGSFAAYAS